MTTKYYLQIEIRYNTPADEEIEGYQQTYFTKSMHSDLFDNEKDCIAYGNKIIEANTWIEQYPGYVGNRLNRKLGYPLVAPRLKNGAEIFISVRSLQIHDSDAISAELQKFNIPRITQKIV